MHPFSALRNRFSTHFPAAALAVGVLFGATSLAGCGGGGTGGDDGGSSGPPIVTSRSFSQAAAAGFQPNYRAELETLRRWPKTTIKVFVRAVNDGRDRTVPVRNAIALWQEATQNFLTFDLVGLESQADIVVNYVPGSTLSERSVGYTTVTFQTPSNTLTRAQVYVAKESDDDVLTQITAHEFGHALGVDGHSQSDLDLMFPRLNLPTRVSESDINTVYSGYSTVAGVSTTDATAGATNSLAGRAAGQTATARIDCVR
jgi:hypothetical protein